MITAPQVCTPTAVVTARLHVSQAADVHGTLTVYFGGPSHLSAHLSAGRLLVRGRRVVRADIICARSKRGAWTPVNGPFLQVEPRRPRKIGEPPYDFVAAGPLAKEFVRDVVDAVILHWLDQRPDVRSLVAERSAAACVQRERQAERLAADAHSRQKARLAAAEAEYLELTGHPPLENADAPRCGRERPRRATSSQLSIL